MMVVKSSPAYSSSLDDARWYTIIDEGNVRIQMDKDLFASRVDDSGYNIVCWMRTTKKKENVTFYINQEFMSKEVLKSRVIQGYIVNGKNRDEIGEWHIVPNESFETFIFNKLVKYDMDKTLPIK